VKEDLKKWKDDALSGGTNPDALLFYYCGHGGAYSDGFDLIVYSIFALYRDTKTIHSIMMIWLVIFIISNYNLASGPPKDPGGVKKHIFKIKGH